MSKVVEAAFGGVSPMAVQDLAKSDLDPKDMNIRGLAGPERAATNCATRTDGYVIPYYTAAGEPLPFYRVKVLTPDLENGAKYKQPRNTANHIYFPPNFLPTLQNWIKQHSDTRVLIITEGEKKAAMACKWGFPAVALGGVDSWRSRTITLPKDTELTSKGKGISAKLPSATDLNETATLATGFSSIVDLTTQYGLTPVIIYDSDKLGTLKSDVQRAATMLAYELRYHGISSNKIRQVVLPHVPQHVRLTSPHHDREVDESADEDEGAGGDGEWDEDDEFAPRKTSLSVDLSQPDDASGGKTALDDFLMAQGAEALLDLLRKALPDPAAFPRHPNPKGFINSRLEGSVGRKEAQQVAAVIITELDARGQRLLDAASGEPFFYSSENHKLMPAVLVDRDGTVLHKSPFGTMLYQNYGLSANDSRVLTWMASLFTGEQPIKSVHPRRVSSLITEEDDVNNPDGIAIQASDSQYFAVSPDPKKPVELLVNGTHGILFEQDQVDPLDTERVLESFDEQNAKPRLRPWWFDVLMDSNLGKAFVKNIAGLNNGADEMLTPEGERMRRYATLLFYISPYLQRWRGIQLPVELMIGEAGSGKSSLYSLRMSILTGRPELRNLPNDIRDWHASITNAGGIHVVDNVHFSQRGLRQQLSDEICRLITEPNPKVEMRKLFTNAEQMRIPVNVTFAMTAINMPFTNTDLMQRAAVFEAAALGKAPAGDWVADQLEKRGGREAWVAHHLVFLHRFLKMADETWDPAFRTIHRLSHLEQALTIAGKVLGIPTDFLSETIQKTQQSAMLDADWTLTALEEFSREHLVSGDAANMRFTANDITEWAQGHPDYTDNPQLTNTRRLGRYLTAHRSELARICYIHPVGTTGNRVQFRFDAAKFRLDAAKALKIAAALGGESPTKEK
jgi:hypothetical protein